jgi:hypothetical protein
MDSLDNSFVSFLRELEKTYLFLDKALRLRTERWIEKLAMAGSNTVWRKHRNAYTRLLLGMVIKKNLEAPFDRAPPEGDLPPFPAHYRALLKGIIGPHESVFWRDLYARLPLRDQDGNASLRLDPVSFTVSHQALSSSSSSSSSNRHATRRQGPVLAIKEGKGPKYEQNSGDGKEGKEHMNFGTTGMKSWADILAHKENAPDISTSSTGVKTMLRDQQSRINFLESTLNSERVTHGVELSRASVSAMRTPGLTYSTRGPSFAPPMPPSSSASFDASLMSSGPTGSIFAGMGADQKPEALDSSSFMTSATPMRTKNYLSASPGKQHDQPPLPPLQRAPPPDDDDDFLGFLEGFHADITGMALS